MGHFRKLFSGLRVIFMTLRYIPQWNWVIVVITRLGFFKNTPESTVSKPHVPHCSMDTFCFLGVHTFIFRQTYHWIVIFD